MIKTKKFALTLIASALVSTGFSSFADINKERDARLRAAEAWMDFQLRDQFIPGATAAMVVDQEVVWSHAFGHSNVRAKQEMTPDNSFSICSISKLFTSIGVMTLVEDGKVELDAPVSKYLEGFELTTTDESIIQSDVTVRQLLSHAGGLPRETSGTHWNDIYNMPKSDRLIPMLSEQERLYSPYANFQYSNLGMSLLGNIIEAVSGKSFHDHINDEILSPLSLDGVRSELPTDYEQGRYATGYKYHNGGLEREAWAPYEMKGYAPAAGFSASVVDLAKFASWHFRLLETGETEVLSRDGLREMQRVQYTDPYDPKSPEVGLGYIFRKLDGKTAIGHGGYCPGYRAELVMRPQDKLAMVGMTNTNDISPSALVNGVAAIAADKVLASVKADEDDSKGESNDDTGHDFFQYEGTYYWPGYNSDFYIIPTSDGVIRLNLSSAKPADAMQEFEHVEGDVFRRKRPDDELGETLTFARDDAGAITQASNHGYVYLKR